MNLCKPIAVAILVTIAGGAAEAQEVPTPPGAIFHSDIAPAQRRVFFGELHLHTTESFDAWIWGTKVTPDQAYKFGRGETVAVPPAQVAKEEGRKVSKPVAAKRAWPLDFMAVTDHSEFMGALAQLDNSKTVFAHSKTGKDIAGMGRKAFAYVAKAPPKLAAEILAAAKASDVWSVEQKAANDNYEPGKFTTFIAYEWSSMPGGRHLHRNVIFNADHAPEPFSSLQSEKAEDLWNYLDHARAKGIDVIAIPHNGNLSGGLMYDWNTSDGRPIDEAYAQQRALNEPLTEITQIKGQSDTTPELSPNDEFANFEVFDHIFKGEAKAQFHHGSYVREAYGRGLIIKSRMGVNPFKYGVVGGADIHNGLSASDENAMAGGPHGIDPKTMQPSPAMAKAALDSGIGHVGSVGHNIPSFYGSAGITGVWAEKNTRNSIFAALKRKETFATSGTRMRVRMFGGWEFKPSMLKKPDWVATAYAKGVAMGSDMPRKPAAAGAPHFILQAAKDPDGANLDRIQVIKVWLDGENYKEKVFDVALSGDRKDDPKTGDAPAVGNTVNLKTATYKNTIGAPVLSTVWQDPEFDPKTPAVYYARVLEIPTPRWSTTLADRNGLPLPSYLPSAIQERAWSSPIWYTP